MYTKALLNHRPEPIEVVVLDRYPCGGVELCSVRAAAGEPFVGGDKWPIKTAYATVKVADLTQEADQPANLLEMALAAAKRQWYAGEVVWVWGDQRLGAFLKETSNDFVNLNLTGYDPFTPIFWMDPTTWAWAPIPKVEKHYRAWVKSYRKATAA
jgi:hypothetical protein